MTSTMSVMPYSLGVLNGLSYDMWTCTLEFDEISCWGI